MTTKSTRLQDSFDRCARRIVELWFDLHPVEATRLGVSGPRDGRFSDRSAAGAEEAVARFRACLEELRAIDPEGLDLARRIDWRLAEGALESELTVREAKTAPASRPQDYVIEIVDGLHWLLVQEASHPGTRLNALLGRLEAAPALLAAARENLLDPPPVFCETAVSAARSALEFLAGDIRAAWSAERDPALQERLERATVGLESALRRYLEFVEGDLMLRARGEFAIGEEAFVTLLRRREQLSVEPEQLLQIGQRVYHGALRRLRREAEAYRAGSTWSELLDELSEREPTVEHPVEEFRAFVAEARAFVRGREMVEVDDDDELEIRSTHAFLRPLVPRLMYTPAPPGTAGHRPVVWVTEPPAAPVGAVRAVEPYRRAHFRQFAAHETYPGHHVQLTRANREGPSLRTIFWSPVMVEGWAVYAEGLMMNAGYFDPSGRFGYLHLQLVRSIGLLTDVGMHTRNMSLGDAEQFLIRKSRWPRGRSALLVRRYAEMPAHPLAFVLGEQLIEDLRDDFLATGRGTLRDFHREFLSHGSLPIPLVREAMQVPPGPGRRMVELSRAEPRAGRGRKGLGGRAGSASPPQS
ncbi:MAG: DUF885 domain-containing protein [Candidatus Eisenbacteria bacterium]|nr:DUF885 domain-containing protein [Candidatus Eisenbacteria bacterium]